MKRRLTDLDRYLRGWINTWSNKDFFRESNSGALLLLFAEPRARWCGGRAG